MLLLTYSGGKGFHLGGDFEGPFLLIIIGIGGGGPALGGDFECMRPFSKLRLPENMGLFGAALAGDFPSLLLVSDADIDLLSLQVSSSAASRIGDAMSLKCASPGLFRGCFETFELW